MEDFLLRYEREIYTGAFFAAVIFVALWEGIVPKRDTSELMRRRWGGNLIIGILGIVLLQLTLPVATVGFALLMESRGIGLLPIIDLPFWVALIMGALAVDFGHYVHHYLLHRVGFLWRFHRIHHADLDYDFTVGFRFHPVEGFFTTLFTFAVIAILGPPAIAVLLVEVVTGIFAAVAHANARTPRWVERYVRLLVVTPGMHRIHHSVRETEHNSNYSAALSVWDRLCGTYVARSAEPQETMEMGLPDLRDPACLTLSWMLLTPFRKTAAAAGSQSKTRTSARPLSS